MAVADERDEPAAGAAGGVDSDTDAGIDTGGRMHRLCRLFSVVGVATLFVCALITVIDIVARRSVGWTLPGMVDLTQLLIMLAVFLCIPFTFERRANVEVELLFDRLPAAVQRWLSMLWPLLGAAFLALVVWYGGAAALQSYEYGDRSQTLNASMLWYWLPLLVGMALSLLICLHQVLRAWRSGRGRAVINAPNGRNA